VIAPETGSKTFSKFVERAPSKTNWRLEVKCTLSIFFCLYLAGSALAAETSVYFELAPDIVGYGFNRVHWKKPDGDGDYAGTTAGEVIYSEDLGESWKVIVKGLAPISKAGHYRDRALNQAA
jgi:hypothetical protein